MKRPSVLSTPSIPRKAPKQRVLQSDEMPQFYDSDIIKDISDISEQSCPNRFHCKQNEMSVIFYKLEFDKQNRISKNF